MLPSPHDVGVITMQLIGASATSISVSFCQPRSATVLLCFAGCSYHPRAPPGRTNFQNFFTPHDEREEENELTVVSPKKPNGTFSGGSRSTRSFQRRRPSGDQAPLLLWSNQALKTWPRGIILRRQGSLLVSSMDIREPSGRAGAAHLDFQEIRELIAD